MSWLIYIIYMYDSMGCAMVGSLVCNGIINACLVVQNIQMSIMSIIMKSKCYLNSRYIYMYLHYWLLVKVLSYLVHTKLKRTNVWFFECWHTSTLTFILYLVILLNHYIVIRRVCLWTRMYLRSATHNRNCKKTTI